MKVIFLILSFMVLASCASPVPVQFIYPIDFKHGVCSKWEIVDKKTMRVQWVEDRPLAACDGYVAISIEDYPKLKAWIIKEQLDKKRETPKD